MLLELFHNVSHQKNNPLKTRNGDFGIRLLRVLF